MLERRVPTTSTAPGAFGVKIGLPVGYGVIGNTADSDSVIPGSSPGTPANHKKMSLIDAAIKDEQAGEPVDGVVCLV